MKTLIKIRGIYSTALTRLLLDSDYAIADPSPEIQGRFSLVPTHKLPEILIKDQEDHQGIEIFGEADEICRLLSNIQSRLLDVALLRFAPLAESERELIDELESSKELVHARLEFGGDSKGSLDLIRSSVAPSLSRHHRLRILHPQKLEKAEKQLGKQPQLKEDLDRTLFQEIILTPLSKAGVVKLEHIKIAGKPVRPREGILLGAKGTQILIKRSFSQGRYDGLDLPIEEGDYSLTEAQEGAWYVKHAYYSKEGRLKGEYYNVNTPVELYPYGARYVDLEIDVVRRVGERPFLVDRENLAVLTKDGSIGAGLEKKALEVAQNLLKH
ncbi:MAG TPA: DUF402 domain-containing protein [Thermodesulfobacteriota bacterium]|nr:DUF402 domain-containing protein [Thermodesulfobacteriota bacterium]